MGGPGLAVDIILPVYNESSILSRMHERLSGVLAPLPYSFTIYYINDGSGQSTCDALAQIAAQDERVVIVELSRNFGQQAALTAGMDLAQGDFVITMDADGQHPPEMIPQMLQLAESGYDMVVTQRMDDPHTGWFKRKTSDLFYRLINRMGDTHILPGSADFRLVSRSALDALRQMPEYHRFLRGMVAWVGFRSIVLPYAPEERIGGASKYSLKKMFRLAMDATFSFSLVPLYLGISMGVFFLVLAAIEAVYVLSFWILGLQSNLAPGWSSLMFMILVVGGILMVLMGFIGIYVGYIFQEVKHRPVYLIKNKIQKSNGAAAKG
jgi:dolichol-phosphate mannosyltransferase